MIYLWANCSMLALTIYWSISIYKYFVKEAKEVIMEMTIERALEILKEPDRCGVHIITANDEETQRYNEESICAFNMAVEALREKTVSS